MFLHLYKSIKPFWYFSYLNYTVTRWRISSKHNHLISNHIESYDFTITCWNNLTLAVFACLLLVVMATYSTLKEKRRKQKICEKNSIVCVRLLISSSFGDLHSTKIKYPKYICTNCICTRSIWQPPNHTEKGHMAKCMTGILIYLVSVSAKCIQKIG